MNLFFNAEVAECQSAYCYPVLDLCRITKQKNKKGSENTSLVRPSKYHLHSSPGTNLLKIQSRILRPHPNRTFLKRKRHIVPLRRTSRCHHLVETSYFSCQDENFGIYSWYHKNMDIFIRVWWGDTILVVNDIGLLT